METTFFTHLINVYASNELSWKWLKTRKEILLFHLRCKISTHHLWSNLDKDRQFSKQISRILTTVTGLWISSKRLKIRKKVHEINCWRRTGLSGICFCFSIPFFVLELYAIKARSLFGLRTQKTREYLKSRENYSSIAFNKCKISDNPCPFKDILMRSFTIFSCVCLQMSLCPCVPMLVSFSLV